MWEWTKITIIILIILSIIWFYNWKDDCQTVKWQFENELPLDELGLYEKPLIW